MDQCDIAYMGSLGWVYESVLHDMHGVGYMDQRNMACMGWGIWVTVTWHTWGGIYGSV